jgi:hypothetical protein
MKLFLHRFSIRPLHAVLLVSLFAASLALTVYAQVGGYIPTVLTPSNASGRVGGPIVVSARLTRLFGGAAVGYQRVQPYIVREFSSTPLGAAYTDANGVVRVTIPAGSLPLGTAYIAWEYAGNGVYSRPLSISNVMVSR